MSTTIKTTTWTLSEGHEITKTLEGDSSIAGYVSATKWYAWSTSMKCSCGWQRSWTAKLSNKTINEAHDQWMEHQQLMEAQQCN